MTANSYPVHPIIHDETAEPNTSFYTLDHQSLLPVLIDSGTSVSIFPLGYANRLEPNLKRVPGITDINAHIDGAVKINLDLRFGLTISHKFFVASLPEKLIILETDFLPKFKIKKIFPGAADFYAFFENMRKRENKRRPLPNTKSWLGKTFLRVHTSG